MMLKRPKKNKEVVTVTSNPLRRLSGEEVVLLKRRNQKKGDDGKPGQQQHLKPSSSSAEQDEDEMDYWELKNKKNPYLELENLLIESYGLFSVLYECIKVDDHATWSKALMNIFEGRNREARLVIWALRKEVAITNIAEERTLFRQSGLATYLFSLECKRRGANYLRATLRPFIQRICEDNVDMEVDPMRVSKGEDLKRNQKRLGEAAQEVLNILYDSTDTFPSSLKFTFLEAQHEVAQRFPNMCNTVVSNFYFLRFIAPALVSPTAFGLLSENPSPRAFRSLMLISKVISNVAYNVAFGEKEAYMAVMNSFIEENQPRMQRFLQTLVHVPLDSSFYSNRRTGGPGTHRTSFYYDVGAMGAAASAAAANAGGEPRRIRTKWSAHQFVLDNIVARKEDIISSLDKALFQQQQQRQPQQQKQKEQDEATDKKEENEQTAATKEETEENLLHTKEALEVILALYSAVLQTSEEEKLKKKQMLQELLGKFNSEGNLLTDTLRPVQANVTPSKRLLHLMLLVEKQRAHVLSEELKLFKLKLQSETKSKRDLQLQILRAKEASSSLSNSNGNSPPLPARFEKEKRDLSKQFGGLYDMLETFKSRLSSLESLVNNEENNSGTITGGSVGRNTGNSLLATVFQDMKDGIGGSSSGSSPEDDVQVKKNRRLSWNAKLFTTAQ
ncbi:GTPase-activator protein for Ras-like GTPases [Balamuthia mandrillaris]